MKKYLLLAVIGLVSASLQTMEQDPRRMEQLRNQRVQFEQQQRKLADFENFLKNEWLTLPKLVTEGWIGFDMNPKFVALAKRAYAKAKEWKIDLDTAKNIFSNVIFDIMIMQKYGAQKGSLEFAKGEERELKKIAMKKTKYQQAGEDYPGSPAVFYTNELFNALNNIAFRQ